MDTVILTLLLSVAGGADGELCFPVPAGETWEVESLAILPNAAASADNTNYQSLRWYKGASTTVTAARATTVAGGALAARTQEAMAITAVGDEKRVTSTSPLNLRATRGGSGVAVNLTAIATFKRLRS